MARSVPKCKRAAYVYDRDFIVVDDISGVLKMRSECAIDGYGFLSPQGDIRNPQETPPIIREQMAAWPDPRPIGQPVFTPSPDYQYFLFNYFVLSVQSGSTTFDATASVGLNAPIASMDWYVDDVYVVSGLVPVVTMTQELHDISVLLTDLYGNEQTFSFEYTRGDDWVGGINTDSDPFFSNVISLLHFDGSGYSQVVVDEIGNTWDIFSYVGGDPSVGIVENKHGIDSAFVINYNSSEYFSPAELRLETPLEFSIFDSTIGDCTIELFFKDTEGAEEWLLYSITGSGAHPSGTSSSFRFRLQYDRLAVLGHYYTPSTGNYFLPDFSVPLEFVPRGVWNHIAFVVSGNTLKCFINGVLRKSETISRTSGLSYEAPNHYLAVGGANRTVDEFRITSGVARYSANFARPIKQFPDHD